MNNESGSAWYREPTMLIVAGVLGCALLSGISMLTLASSQQDRLVISDQDYQAWRDAMRATTPTAEDD